MMYIKIILVVTALVYAPIAAYFLFFRKKKKGGIQNAPAEAKSVSCVTVRIKGRREPLNLAEFSNMTFEYIQSKESRGEGGQTSEETQGEETGHEEPSGDEAGKPSENEDSSRDTEKEKPKESGEKEDEEGEKKGEEAKKEEKTMPPETDGVGAAEAESAEIDLKMAVDILELEKKLNKEK